MQCHGRAFPFAKARRPIPARRRRLPIRLSEMTRPTTDRGRHWRKGAVESAVVPLWLKDSPAAQSLALLLICFAILPKRNARCAFTRESRAASGTQLGCPKGSPTPNISPLASHEEAFDLRVDALRY